MMGKIVKIKGGLKKDENGSVSFVNGFKLNDYSRFYQINLPKKNFIRAFHGHMKEKKAVFPISGSILLCFVEIDNKIAPSRNKKVKKVLLDSRKPMLVEIPAGYANGIMSLENQTNVIFFSNKTLEQSKKDDYRFSPNYWGEKVWKK